MVPHLVRAQEYLQRHMDILILYITRTHITNTCMHYWC